MKSIIAWVCLALLVACLALGSLVWADDLPDAISGVAYDDWVVSGNVGNSIQVPTEHIIWKPQKDITAYELAKCMDIFIQALVCSQTVMCDGTEAVELWKTMPDEIKRHWEYHE